MVDVGDKPVTYRRVRRARCGPDGARDPGAHRRGKIAKGDVLATARIAGIQAAKRTDEWIPLCHSLSLDGVDIELVPEPERSRVRIEATARAHAKTGVEMEALVAVSAAALVIYDMCKAIDRGMVVEAVHLVSKSGGKSGTWQRNDDPLKPKAPG